MPTAAPVPGPAPAPAPAPAPTPSPAPTPPVDASALSIDSGATGNPIAVRVARSANGDGFAVWQADDGLRRNLWANRYRAATATWGDPVNIEASTEDIDDFQVTVDANGNAVVAWHQLPFDRVWSARFEASAGAWAMPVLLATNASQPRIASDATGAVLVVYGGSARGRFFDPATGTWRPEDSIEQSSFGTGGSFGAVPLLDGHGNALVVYVNERTGASILASNYFTRSTGSWGKLPPDAVDDILYPVTNSFIAGFNDNLQLALSGGGNFLLAWQGQFDQGGAGEDTFEIRLSRFTCSTKTWRATRTQVPVNPANDVRFQRLAGDAAGNVLLLWTETDGVRTALRSIRLNPAGELCGCSTGKMIDAAVGGGAARADLAVDPQGNAVAIWQQFEGGRPDDGSRSNIALNRFDGTTHTWGNAMLAEAGSGNAISPSASAAGGQVLLGWIQDEGGVNHVKAMQKSLAATGP